MSGFEVQIEGEYGVDDGSIHLLQNGVEVVMWDSAEWIEDPSVVYVIANAIAKGYNGELISGSAACKHCQHGIVMVAGSDTWVAPDAGFDREFGDGIWRDSCPDNHESPEAPHEPEED